MPPTEPPRQRASKGAFRKGYEACRRGEPRESPYPDWRTDRGSVTFSRAFDRYWLDGWDAAAGEQESARQLARLAGSAPDLRPIPRRRSV